MTISSETAARAAEIIARYPQPRSALVPLLFLAQAEHGFLGREDLDWVGDLLGLTAAEVGAVSSFYSMLKRSPTGEYVVSVCTNVPCALRGADEVFARIAAALALDGAGTSSDGKVTLEAVECLAACDKAPVVSVNYENYERVSPEAAEAIVRGIRSGQLLPAAEGEVPEPLARAHRRLAGLEGGRLDPGEGQA
ncbi:MAG: NAD(P)H-dependent oxidoreductase subunit E [Actinomycetota bacterium]